ncbi:hypothetical protein CRYUN_Cryun36dG0045200 [Craigia yunnanensis]
MGEVKLVGSWFTRRYNIPILIHGGKPICESMIILEYLEDVWPYNPLLPNGPFDKATAQFWIKFAKGKIILLPLLSSTKNFFQQDFGFYRTENEEQEEAMKESLEMLQIIKEYALGDERKFFGGDKINMVDIAFRGLAHWLGIIEDVVRMKLIKPHKFPRLNQWIEHFKLVPIIKENLLDRDATFAYLKHRLEMPFASKVGQNLPKVLFDSTVGCTNSNTLCLMHDKTDGTPTKTKKKKR